MGYVITHARRNRANFTRRNKITSTPIQSKTNKANDISSVVTGNQWSGKRCFILGGGDSLRGFDYSVLDGELTIGINRIFEVYDSTINYSMDANFSTWLHNYKSDSDDGRRRILRWQEFKGLRLFLESPGVDFGTGTFFIKRMAERAISLSPKRGIYGGTNSGFGAIMLAICLGCKEIYLLGFDMKVEGDRTHWHDGYPGQNRDRTAKVLNNFTKLFNEFATPIARLGVKVYNLNPNSALECFDKLEVTSILSVRKGGVPVIMSSTPMSSYIGKHSTLPVIVSFYTKDTGYETEAKRLADSLRKFELDYEIVGISDRKNWQLNVRYKPTLIRKMLNRFKPRPVLYVDADAVFCRFPSLFASPFQSDIGLHRVNWKAYGRDRPDELLGGTVYMSDTPRVQAVLEKWIQECETRHLSIWDQKILQEIIGNNFVNLPPEYCTIFDSMGGVVKEPVILHNQASRRLKSNYVPVVRMGRRMRTR